MTTHWPIQREPPGQLRRNIRAVPPAARALLLARGKDAAEASSAAPFDPVKGGGKVDHVGGSTAGFVAVENRSVLCLS